MRRRSSSRSWRDVEARSSSIIGGVSQTDDARAYRRKLLFFLGVATFFEGFDQMALAQLLPSVQRDFGLDEFQVGVLVAFARNDPQCREALAARPSLVRRSLAVLPSRGQR